LPDIDSAEKKARDLAAELARDLTSEETTRNVSVEVQDERGQKLITVTVMMTVERYATGVRS
jgi:hypothetical protein